MLFMLKNLHLATAALSFLGFFVRGIWMLQDSPRLGQRWVRILPHVIDTLLLVSAIVLAVQLQLSPLQHPWLLVKIMALPVYIGLGVVALRRGRSKAVRTWAWLAGMAVFLFIVAVAVSKSPWGLPV